MRKFLVIVAFLFSLQGFSQYIFGEWEVIDRKRVSKCIVRIYKEQNKVFGKITNILIEEDKNAICTKCVGSDKDKPILGFVLIRDMKKTGKYYKGGTIFDPENGEEYKCRLTLKDNNTLQVRGYLAFLYSTQYWKRVN